jgi:hypothetical protein
MTIRKFRECLHFGIKYINETLCKKVWKKQLQDVEIFHGFKGTVQYFMVKVHDR